MAVWEGVVTNSGRNLEASWLSGTTLNIDSAKGGTGTVSSAALMAQTGLVGQRQILSIIANEAIAGGIRLKVQITAPETGYTLNQLGIWGSINGGATTMIALFQSSVGVPIPALSEMPDFIFTFYGVIQVSNEGTLTVTLDTSMFISLSKLNAAIETHNTNGDAHEALLAGKSGLSTMTSATLATASWIGSEAPYSYTYSHGDIAETNPVELLPGSGITAVQLEALQRANIIGGTQSAGNIELLAYGDKPEIDVPVMFIFRRDL